MGPTLGSSSIRWLGSYVSDDPTDTESWGYYSSGFVSQPGVTAGQCTPSPPPTSSPPTSTVQPSMPFCDINFLLGPASDADSAEFYVQCFGRYSWAGSDLNGFPYFVHESGDAQQSYSKHELNQNRNWFMYVFEASSGNRYWLIGNSIGEQSATWYAPWVSDSPADNLSAVWKVDIEGQGFTEQPGVYATCAVRLARTQHSVLVSLSRSLLTNTKPSSPNCIADTIPAKPSSHTLAQTDALACAHYSTGVRGVRFGAPRGGGLGAARTNDRSDR